MGRAQLGKPGTARPRDRQDSGFNPCEAPRPSARGPKRRRTRSRGAAGREAARASVRARAHPTPRPAPPRARTHAPTLACAGRSPTRGPGGSRARSLRKAGAARYCRLHLWCGDPAAAALSTRVTSWRAGRGAICAGQAPWSRLGAPGPGRSHLPAVRPMNARPGDVMPRPDPGDESPRSPVREPAQTHPRGFQKFPLPPRSAASTRSLARATTLACLLRCPRVTLSSPRESPVSMPPHLISTRDPMFTPPFPQVSLHPQECPTSPFLHQCHLDP